jgi:diguanylate cyclase (GGDEF)-like protein
VTRSDRDAPSSTKERPWLGNLNIRIAGIVFWGQVFLGVILIALLLLRMEPEVRKLHEERSRFARSQAESALKAHGSSAEVAAALKRIVDGTEIVGLEVQLDGPPVVVGNKPAGAASIAVAEPDSTNPAVTIYMKPWQKELQKRRNNTLLMLGLFLLAFAFILQRILYRTLSRPFGAMVEAAKRYSDGDESARFDDSRKDEFGYLGRFVNKALEASQDKREALELALTQVRESEQELSYQASHDPLTGLRNRRSFERLIKEAIQDAEMRDKEHALCYIDLDEFKIVNDSCGHAAGDDLLRKISALFQEQVRATDIIARLGGDEFGFILHTCSIEKAEEIADKVRRAVKDFRFQWKGRHFSVGASIGVVPILAGCDGVAAVMSAADMACYSAKDQGKNQVFAYSATSKEMAVRRSEMQWASRLTRAIDEKRFVLYCQPIVSVQDTEVSHYEILIRMVGEDGELISPGRFLPSAERYGFITAVDMLVVEEVFTSCSAWLRAQPQASLSINISGKSVGNTELAALLKQRIAEEELHPGQICLEITETSAVGDLDKALSFMSELREAGCSFALDDFGKGLSSLSYLMELDVEYLKIDGSFVVDIASNSVHFAMVEAVQKISSAVGIKTVAEYVENAEIVEALERAGVDFLQGYHVGRPQPIEEMLEQHMGNSLAQDAAQA